jgi:hypothetical protein
MKSPSWTWADFGITMAVVMLFGSVMFVIGVYSLINLRRLLLTQPMVSGRQLFAPFAGILSGVVITWIAYTAANKHRLLRGECRYTVAQVYENWRYKGDKESRFEFWVNGELYRFDERMSWRGGWRPLHSRWYVRYAVPDPDAYEYTDIPVPDSVRTVPPDGWAGLPKAPAPTPVPESIAVPSAPANPQAAPLTGPAASPVFAPARPDSAARPAGNPLAAPSPTLSPPR